MAEHLSHIIRTAKRCELISHHFYRPQERERTIAEAKASLETARRGQEEESRKVEAAAKARDAERAREQAEVDRKAEENRQEVHGLV